MTFNIHVSTVRPLNRSAARPQELMKRITLYLVLVTGCFPALAQQPATVTDDDFQKVLVAVSNEDWDAAVSLSSRFIKQMKDEDKRLPRLRYIYLYAAAGKVTNGNMEFDDLARLANELVGKPVEVPYRPITLQCRGAFNFICPSGDKNDRIIVAASNKTATSILAFEYTQLKEPFDFEHHLDETASISGTIESIVPNPNKSRAIVLRLFISSGVLNLKDKPPKQASHLTRANKSLHASRTRGLLIDNLRVSQLRAAA
jgi:hypothetical protein